MADLTRVPVILVSGVQESAMLSACLSLQFGLPDTVAERHTIDVGGQMLTHVVSDVTGVLEREEINLAYACVSCAIREDIVPTLERLAATRRWRGIVACLPIAAEALQVCRVVCWSPHNAPHVAVAAVVAALDGATVADDLLAEDLLDDRGLATAEGDRRGVAEVASSMVEYADLVCLTSEPDPDEVALVRALTRPRGCFWVPTRPDAVCVWDGAGGQAIIGSRRTWNGRPPLTRIIVVGFDDGAVEIMHAFHRCLLTVEELATRGRVWNEPWLGPTSQAA